MGVTMVFITKHLTTSDCLLQKENNCLANNQFEFSVGIDEQYNNVDNNLFSIAPLYITDRQL